jgi:hypothetical protein
VCDTAFAAKASHDCDWRELFGVDIDSLFSLPQDQWSMVKSYGGNEGNCRHLHASMLCPCHEKILVARRKVWVDFSECFMTSIAKSWIDCRKPIGRMLFPGMRAYSLNEEPNPGQGTPANLCSSTKIKH